MALISATAMEETIAFKKQKLQCELFRRIRIKMLMVGFFQGDNSINNLYYFLKHTFPLLESTMICVYYF